MRLQSQPQPSSPYEQAQNQRCAKSDCQQDGLFPAPSDGEKKSTRAWLCLEHARAANNAWNYYEHKSNEDIEKALRDSAVGYRPTWPMNPSDKRNAGVREKRSARWQELKNSDKNFTNIFIDIFAESSSKAARRNEQQQGQENAQENAQGKVQGKNFDAQQSDYDNESRSPRNREERKACRVLELTPPINAKELKTRYRALAKAHHPDHHTANGSADGVVENLVGNSNEQARQQKQERLKQINVAYSLLQGLWSRQTTS